jgi:hypothetical protein
MLGEQKHRAGPSVQVPYFRKAPSSKRVANRAKQHDKTEDDRPLKSDDRRRIVLRTQSRAANIRTAVAFSGPILSVQGHKVLLPLLDRTAAPPQAASKLAMPTRTPTRSSVVSEGASDRLPVGVVSAPAPGCTPVTPLSHIHKNAVTDSIHSLSG